MNSLAVPICQKAVRHAVKPFFERGFAGERNLTRELSAVDKLLTDFHEEGCQHLTLKAVNNLCSVDHC